MTFVPDRGLDRDLAALVGLGLPTPEGFSRVREWLTCRACGKRGTTLHHVVPNWICRATGAKEVLESLCPSCHAAAERLAWEAAERVLRKADLLAIASRSPRLVPAVAAWNEWVRWALRKRNLESAGRDPSEAAANEREARKRLGPLREKLRDALRRAAAELCRDRVDYLAMVPAWRAGGVTGLDSRRFVRPPGRSVT